ncbi:MAG TPA: YihY/virulence factor BrkB family protein [Chthoniobacterales bacterium]|jgi:membrane protein
MAAENKFRAGWMLLKNSGIEWWNDNTFRLAASLAFYTIFSVAPVLLIAVGTASLFFTRQTAVNRVVEEMQRLVGRQGAGAIRQVLESSAGLGKGAWAIAIGIVTLILGASVVFAELQSALNAIWNVKVEVRRGFVLDYVIDRLRSFSIALGVGFLLLVSLVLSAALSALQDYMTTRMPSLPVVWQAGNIVISFVVVAILFAMIYKYLPDVQIGWRDVWIGAVVTSFLFNGGKYLIGIYLGHAAIGSAFGAAGSFAVLLVWIYYSALISFFGAEFTQVYARRHGRQIQPEGHARTKGEEKSHA